MPDPRPIIPPCVGKCRGERAPWESPAKYIDQRYPDGRKMMGCTCCGQILVIGSTADFGEAMRQGRIDPSVKAENVTLLQCVACGYDQFSMRALSPT